MAHALSRILSLPLYFTAGIPHAKGCGLHVVDVVTTAVGELEFQLLTLVYLLLCLQEVT